MPKLLVISFLASVCIAFAFGYFVMNSAFVQDKKNYAVAIVGEVDESYLGYGIKAVQSLDDSSFMVDFLVMDEEEAKSAFIDGKLTGYVVIPEGLVDSLSYGRNDRPIKYIICEGQKGITSILIGELADIVSILITHSQAAVFGMQKILMDRGMWEILDEATDEMNLNYIGFVLMRTDLVETESLGISEGLSVIAYYICGLLVLIVILMGINYSVCTTAPGMGLNRVFASKGLKVPVQVLSEYLAYLVMMFFSVLSIVFLVTAAAGTGVMRIEEWEIDRAWGIFRLVFHLIPVLGMLSAMQFFFYEIMQETVSSILIQFAAGIGMCYLSGCFYPRELLPSLVTAVGDILPTGVAMSFLGEAFSKQKNILNIVELLLYWFTFYAAACAVRSRKICKDSGRFS